MSKAWFETKETINTKHTGVDDNFPNYRTAEWADGPKVNEGGLFRAKFREDEEIKNIQKADRKRRDKRRQFYTAAFRVKGCFFGAQGQSTVNRFSRLIEFDITAA